MRERPILFSGAMVRAILNGRKTQTRRVVRFKGDGGYTLAELAPHRHVWECHKDDGTPQWQDYDNIIPNPYGSPGDRLWVRETWDYKGGDEDMYQREPRAVMFRSDNEFEPLHVQRKWRPSIFMPRWASRLTLEVEAVRVERVQEITEADSRAEGAPPAWLDENGKDVNLGQPTYRQGFALLWNSINAKSGFGWDANPFVWVVTFRRVEAQHGR